MGRFDDTGAEKYLQQSKNPAAPEGLKQQAKDNAGGPGRFGDTSQLQKWEPTDYVEQSQGWFSGANSQGTNNGWDNQFVRDFTKNWNEALADGTATSYFSKPDATGVVTWDHTGEDGTHFRFGDVYENGRKTGNLYDLHKDRGTADLMMAPWIMTPEQQARTFSASDRMDRLASEIDDLRHERNQKFEEGQQAVKFQHKVKDTEAKFQEGSGDEWLAIGGGAAGGAVTGAGAGAAVGAIFGGVGAVPGAAVGGALGALGGALGGFLNKDELAEQAARGYEISKLSFEENGFLGGASTAIEQGAQFSTHLTSPLGNLAHGAVEFTGDNKIGDGESARYAVDKKGESTAPTWAKVADWSAMVGDGLMQFASPLNRAIYTAQMGAQIGGAVGELAFTGGKQFDPRRGDFNNIFVDDKGHFDPVSGAAGIANIGIDAVQVAGLRGLAGKFSREATLGSREAELAGHRFLLDEAGKVTGVKKTMGLLAPSEQVAWASAARDARVAAMKEGRAVTADDFYKAASNLANGSNRLKAALVNAIGEGFEEGTQEVLEPMSQDGQLSFRNIATSYLYGAAGGLGMSMGAGLGFDGKNLNALTNDQRLSLNAYRIETLRRGEEPDQAQWDAEWAKLSDTEKRMRNSRTAVDAALTQAAAERVLADQAATLPASEVDVAKATDARRAAVEMDLKNNTDRTDAFHVMSGQLDAGRVDVSGALVGDTAPAEAIEMSARTVYRALANRLRGIELQADTVAKTDPALADSLRLSHAFGEQLVADVGDIVAAIHDENTTASDAQTLTRQLNSLLEGFFRGAMHVTAPEGFAGTEDELKLAAAHFVSLLQAREPKLDAGSWVAALPRASWKLTREGADNFVMVNTDIVQALNGDFDGDKLRAENQLVLSPERFAQIRGGQLLGGAGQSIDIGTRNFDKGFVGSLATGLASEPGPLKDEAEATMDAIASAITHRYGRLMSPDALSRVLGGFRSAVEAGSAEARLTLLNGLAREAGEKITELGKSTLNNEWLWASKVVRANLQQYQGSYFMHRMQGSGPSETAPVEDFDTPQGVNRRKALATTDAESLALFAAGNTIFRQDQKIHYVVFNSAVLSAATAEQNDLYEFAKRYEELGRGVTRSELARVTTDDTVAARAVVMLQRIVESMMNDEEMAGKFNPATAMAIIANTKVKDVWFERDGAVTDDQQISLAQLVLKRALDADREEHKRTFDTDEKLKAKHARLRALTIPNSVNGDVNAERAYLEIFKAVPFGNTLGQVTGHLMPHTTPEQWLRNYISLDQEGRTQLERFYTNVPEYLNRKERSNIPYSWDEASRREVSPYRSMLDALLAVGRAELTFDPAKPAAEAFGGARAEVSKRAMDDFRETHALVVAALADFRKITNRSAKTREERAVLAQQMFAANPARGREILNLIPDAQANALFEDRDGELYVAPWVYKTFAIDDADEALVHYWKNLTWTKWFSTLQTINEDDGPAAGRRYDKLQSRFQRFLYELNREPGQPHMDLLLRQMDTAKNLDELFVWINSTPGLRPANSAVLLPFNDDVAEFEADAGGGWSTAKAGSDLRQAIATAKRGAEQLRKTMAFRQEKAATDKTIHEGLVRALSGDPAATRLDHENLRKLAKVVSISTELPRGTAPNMMLALTQGALRGFDAHSHDKGVTADTYQSIGEFQALADAFGFVPGLERAMEVLTSHSIGSLRSNVGDIARTSGTAMDAHGRQVQWAPMTLEQAVEMLGDERTAPLAHLLLTPTALDVTPTGLSERLLMEASLKDLLDDEHYKELFRDSKDGQLDRALRAGTLVDAKARAEGGNYDLIRAVNDFAAVKLTGLGRPATENDLAKARNEAYLQLIQVGKMVGQIQATPEMRDAGTLQALRETALNELRQQRLARALPSFTDSSTGLVVQEWVDGLLQDLEAEKTALLDSLTDLYDGEELDRQSEVLERQYARNAARIRGMMDDNQATATMERFRLHGDPVTDMAAHAQIIEYARSMASFPTRAPEAASAWSKMADQLDDGLSPVLEEGEWDLLSRACMGIHMVDQTLRVAMHVAVPPFPKGDPAVSDARFYKYFDPSFSFLITNMLTEDSPLTRAFTWLHTVAEQPRTTVSQDKMMGLLRRTVLDRSQFGTWTPGLMTKIVQAQERMDSAAAGQGIPMAGNGQKRWAAVAAAVRRTGEVPGPDLLTTATLTGDLLAEDAHPFNEIPVTPAGVAEPTAMPVAMLNNRFFASVKIDGTEIPLDTENLGYGWDGADDPHPYRYIALPRLREVLTRYAALNKKKLADVALEVQFFHPDSQPAKMMNNAFFEGMNHELLPDGSESVIAGLWSDNGGMISTDTQRPLDAGKKGKRAVQPFRRDQLVPGLAQIETEWLADRDFAKMLRRKAELLMKYDDGNGSVEPSFYNAVLKHMKLSHILVGTVDGKPAALHAEQVIALQAAGGRQADLGLENPRLVKLSADVLRTMLGDTGDQGVNRFFDDEYQLNPNQVTAYAGITSTMLDRFGAGWLAEVGTPADTSLANIGHQKVLRVRTVLTDAERNARDERVVFLKNRSADARNARSRRLDKADVRKGYLAALQLASGSIGTERTTFDFAAVNSGVIAPRNVAEAEHSVRLLDSLKGISDANSYERGFVVQDEGVPSYPDGVLTLESLTADRDPENWVVMDDIALLKLNTFEKPERTDEVTYDRVEKALRYLSNSGARIALGSGNAGGDLRFHAAQYLLTLGYAPVAGSKHIYEPVEFSFQTQSERAYESTLTERQLFHPARNVITFLSSDSLYELDENSAMLNPASTKLRDRKVLNNIVPSSSAFSNYNLPLEDNLDHGLYAKTLVHLRSVLDPGNAEARAALVQMAGPDPIDVMPITEALDRYHAKISNASSLTPEVGDRVEPGDIIPFVHGNGRVILYRHGFELPQPEDLADLLRVGGMNVALAKSKTEPRATANAGVITEDRPRPGFGRTLQLESPLQPYGDKVVLEWNGMKYVVVPPPGDFSIPQVFANGTVVDLISDLASADAKEAFEGRLIGYRNALAFFQFDFTDDLTKFFFPNENSRDPQARMLTYHLLSRLAAQEDIKIPMSQANALAKANVAVADLLGEFAAAEAEQVDSDWLDRLTVGEDATTQIARAVVTYLMTHGAEVDNVLKSAGFSHPNAGTDSVQAQKVPGLFADLLDNGLDSELHKELVRRFDGQFHRGPNGEGFKLHTDWSVEMFDGKGGSVRGYLQFGEAHSSGDNPLLDGQAFDPNEASDVSAHNTMAASLSLGATTAHKPLRKSRAFARSFARGQGVPKLASGDSVWQALTALPDEKDPAMSGFRRETEAESLRRAAARKEITGFFQPLNTDDWSEEQVTKYQAAATKVLGVLNLYGVQRAMVDTWVRQHLGRPHGVDETGTELGVISFDDVMETVAEIRHNVNSGLLPTAGANVPLLDVNHLSTIYMANHTRGNDAWLPRAVPADPSSGVAAWDGWVDIAFGTAWINGKGEDGIGAEPDFDQIYLLAIDGLMHGYQGATTSTRYLPVSSDTLRNRLLADPKTGAMLVSISADENLMATDPTLFNARAAELEDIISGQHIYGPGRKGPDPASAKGRQRTRIDRWRREVSAPRQANRKMRGVRGAGQTFLGHTTTTNAAFRMMINLRAGNAMLNPALVVSAPFEAFYRRSINMLSNVAVGESTGKVGELQMRLTERYADTKIGAVAAALGWEPMYTSSDQLKQVNDLVGALASQHEFKSLVYKELAYQYPTMPGILKVEKWLESYAKLGARLQDPAWGMLPKDLSRIYLETVARRLSRTPGDKVYSIDRMINGLARDPEWIKKNDLEAHNLAIAAISQVRSLKPNVISLAFRGAVEPLAESDKFVRNATGNMLKMMTLFQNFWSNFGITITGMQGPADFMAFWLDGRQKKVTARIQAALRGEPYNPADPEYYDMSEVLESLDLADSFIRSGVTWSGLFAFGLMSGGLGLTGDDDEMKFRRRQAELQGVPEIYDPVQMWSDFRNKDSLYLNWLPFGLDSLLKNPDQPVQMNWTVRTFLSPILGMERFYNTGDFMEVIYGFKDAIGSHPIVNEQLWNIASETAAELHAQANDNIEAGDTVAGAHKMMTAVGVLERMLFENSAANMIYQGMDEYDRDQYVLPLTDSDGVIQRDIEGNARPNNLSMETFLDPDTGKLRESYSSRSDNSAAIHTYTENRFTMALVSSLFTGGIDDSDYWRYNMPIKTRTIEHTALTKDQAEAAVRELAAQQLKIPRLTQDEIAYALKGQAMKTKNWDLYNNIDSISAGLAKQEGAEPLSVLDEHGREVITKAGAEGVFRGLYKGTVRLDAESLRGLYIPYEMRQEIVQDWAKELVQEGVDLNLTHSAATYRMKRILYGTGTDNKGLAGILFAKPEDGGIDYHPTQTYAQLNTTYQMGPDGRPWATGFTRDGLLGALGLKPFKTMIGPAGSSTTMDSRGNTVDLVNGINTGLRALKPLDDSRNIPTDVEIGKSIEKAIADAAKQHYTQTRPGSKSGSGYGGYKKRGYSHGGYGGGGGGYFSKAYSLPDQWAPYGHGISFINTNTPIIRRAFVRRERIDSSRGRLNQWQ